MNKRRLGNSDLDLTTVGFGTWALGGSGWAFSWGQQDDRESIDAIKKALDLGINWIDTAAIYGLGHSEEIVAKALKGKRDEVIIATKCALVWDSKGRISGRLKKESVRKECEDSLKRLKTDYIDLYQIHWPNPDSDIEEGWTEMLELKERKLIRFAGVSNFNARQLERAQKIGQITSLQPPYSMLERDVERNVFDLCKKHNIGVVAYSPLQVGLLTGKFTKEKVSALAPDDWRKTKSRDFKEPYLSANLDFVEKLKPVASECKMTLAQLAIAWVLRLPVVTSAIVGARRPSQIEETAPAGDMTVPEKAVNEIEELLKARENNLKSQSRFQNPD